MELEQLYYGFLLKQILDIEKYFYVPIESQLNNQIKDIIVNTGLIFNLLLILDDQRMDSKLRSDIQFKFIRYLGMDQWTNTKAIYNRQIMSIDNESED